MSSVALDSARYSALGTVAFIVPKGERWVWDRGRTRTWTGKKRRGVDDDYKTTTEQERAEFLDNKYALLTPCNAALYVEFQSALRA